MAVLTDDMARLRSEIGVMRGQRGELREDIAQATRERKAAVNEMQVTFDREHAETARVSRQERMAVVSSIKANVSALEDEFHKDLAGIRAAHAEMAEHTRHTTKTYVAGMKAEVGGMKARFHDDHEFMAKTTKANRAAFLSGLKAEVSGMQAGFRKHHEAMAKGGKTSRLAFLSGVEANVAQLQAGFQKSLADSRHAYADMVKEARMDRSAFVSGMKHAVTGLRKQNAEDITGAHFAWLGVTTPAQRQKELKAERQRQEAERQAKLEELRRRQEAELEEKREAEPLAQALAERHAVEKPETAARVQAGRQEREPEQPGAEERKHHKKEKMR